MSENVSNVISKLFFSAMSDDRLLKSLVFGMADGESRATCTEMGRRHSDVVRSRRPGSNDDDRGQSQLREIRGYPYTVLAEHVSEGGGGRGQAYNGKTENGNSSYEL